MPSYFYHLVFELYPTAAGPAKDAHLTSAKADIRVPAPGTDLFALHLHDRTENEVEKQTQAGAQEVGKNSNSAGTIHGDSHERSSHQSPHTAIRDWRFGPVRLEGLDLHPRATGDDGQNMTMTMKESPGTTVAGATSLTDRVTKARFEALETTGSNLGWGVVHLYREGDETPELGSVADARVRTSTAERNGHLVDSVANEEEPTTLCIPAVPSYLTPSDFLGFVGDKTRAEVSHFRMVLTGRMNRYLVLMKFRSGSYAKKWRREWDGKVFNTMEVSCY